MVTDIYGGIYGKVLRGAEDWNSPDDIEIHIWTDNTSAHNPSLVVPNLLAAKYMRDYLDLVIKAHPKYFRKRE